MSDRIRPFPVGRHTATPYLVVDNATEAIDFYKRAFGAKEVMRIEQGGKIGHAQVRIGNSHIMISDEQPEARALSPKTYGGSPVRIFLYVRNVDTFVFRAVAIGARLLQLVDDKVYGDRSGSLEDPFGHFWHITTRKEDLSADAIRQRADFVASESELRRVGDRQ